MSRKNESPDERVKNVTDETARVLSEAVAHFTKDVLESHVDGLISKIRKTTQDSVDKQQEALDALKVINLRISNTLDTFWDKAEERQKEAEEGYQQIVDQSVDKAVAIFNTNLEPLLTKAEEVSTSVRSVEYALLQAEDKYLKTADERLKMIESGHQTLIDNSVGRVAGELRQKLQPLLENTIISADSLVYKQQRAVEEFKDVAGKFEKNEAENRILIRETMEETIKVLKKELQPLLEGIVKAEAVARESTNQLDETTRSTTTVIVELQEKSASFGNFIKKLDDHLEASSITQERLRDDVRLRMDAIEKGAKRTAYCGLFLIILILLGIAWLLVQMPQV